MPLTQVVNKFNRGEVDPRALAREDVTKIANSAELVTNFMPIRLGPMMFRPGTEYLSSLLGSTYFVPFVRATDSTAAIEFSNELVRIWFGDSLVTRGSVTCTIANPYFTTDLTGWTDDSGTGSSTSHDASGYAVITGSGTTKGALYQSVSTSSAGSEHAIRITVIDAPVTLKLGSSAGSTEYYEGTLLPGIHSLAFTPTGTFYVYLENSKAYNTLIDSVEIESSGVMTLPCSVTEASLPNIRYSQSADIVYFACDGYAQFQIERRGDHSWSIVDYRAEDGPFNVINDTDITMTAGAISGNTTLTASRSYFTTNSVGQLFKLDSAGQVVEKDVSAADNGTNSILVTGVGSSRKITISRQGTWVATVTLQRSADDVTWEDVTTYTATGITTYNDGFDNSDFYYRLWVKTGDYTSGTVSLTMTYPGGSISGICKVLQYNSATSVDIQVLQDMGSTLATRDWYPGSWSVANGYPSSVAIYEGRVWWAGKNKLWGSVSDDYTSFNRDTTNLGDSASIQRTIGFGPVDTVLWLSPSTRLIMGLASDEISVRSSSYGEVLTQANVNLKAGSSRGVANIDPLIIDGSVYYVQRSDKRLNALAYDIQTDSHQAVDLMTLHQDIASTGIVRIAVTRFPETRIFIVLGNGDLLVYLMDAAENVAAWSRVTTDGDFKDVYVLPSSDEDRVYFSVYRNGTYYHEKLGLFSEAIGGTKSNNLDAHVSYTSPGTTLTGLDHIADGTTIGIWADGQFREEVTVSSGSATVSGSWATVVAGIRFTAQWQSGKVSHYINKSVLAERKRITKTALIMYDYWPGAVTLGPDFSTLQAMDVIPENPTNSTITEYDEVAFNFNGDGIPDPRVCIQANNPCTIMALIVDVKHNAAASNAG